MKSIILCCGANGRAVLFGEVEQDPVPGEPVKLRNARMIIYWARECGGLLGLAARGPKDETRITHAVPAVTETVWQEFVETTAEAATLIREWPADGE